MGWFSKSEAPTQQFGAPSMAAPAGMMGYNGMMMGQQDPTMAGMMQQNPMMQQMANDPVIATAKLLSYHDPVGMFILSNGGNNMGLMMDLIGEVVSLAMKDFFTGVTFVMDEENKLRIDTSSLPTNLVSLSPENLRLTMGSLQSAVQVAASANDQQRQVLLAAHNPLLQGQQPGFFGSLLGNIINNQASNMGGYGAMGAAGMALV